MKTAIKRIRQYVAVGLVALLCNACVKDDIEGNGNGGSADNAGDFGFATSRQAELAVDFRYPYKMRAYVEAYTQNPLETDEYGNLIKKEGVEPFAQVYTDENGKLSVPVELPAATNEIYLYSPTLGAPTLTSYALGNSASKTVTAVRSTVTRATKSYYSNWAKQSLTLERKPQWDNTGKPDNLLTESLPMDEKTLEVINATIPKGERLDLRFCGISDIALSESAHVDLFYAFDKTTRNNALAYYSYTGPQPSQAWINSHLTLLFPRLSSDALESGSGVRLMYDDGESLTDVFPAGAKIGFVLLVDAWNSGQVETNNIHVMYSDKTYNRYNLPGQIKADRPQMAAFYTDNSKQNLILSFEDQPWTESPGTPYPGDFCDNVFVLKADPVSALPDDVEPGKDPDKPDYGMEFNSAGTLVFEDVWPYQGDYDLNDVVVGYQSKYYMNMDYDLTAFEDEFTFLNDGAQYKNGFGFQLETPASNIASCDVVSSYSCPGQGLDPDLKKATVMLFDNGKQVPKGTTFTVKIVYKVPVSPWGYRTAPYNPFITVCGTKEDASTGYVANGRKEVHLVNYEPTAKMDLKLLHTGHDLSVPDNEKYFLSDASFPFGLNLSGCLNYIIPGETNRIDIVYPRFKSWVESGGTHDNDWYVRPEGE